PPAGPAPCLGPLWAVRPPGEPTPPPAALRPEAGMLGARAVHRNAEPNGQLALERRDVERDDQRSFWGDKPPLDPLQEARMVEELPGQRPRPRVDDRDDLEPPADVVCV